MRSNNRISRRQFIKTTGLTTCTALMGGNICKAKVHKGKTHWLTTGKDYNVTFFITADTHYGTLQVLNNEQLNKDIIANMNNIPNNLNFPAFLGGKLVQQPRGVLVAGDLTDLGEQTEWDGYAAYDGFIDDYDGTLNYPLYEGYGNHDVESLLGTSNYARERVKYRTQNYLRPNVNNISTNGYHYSWDWDQLHLVCLNLGPGTSGEFFNSLAFLASDLPTKVGSSEHPVIIYFHYNIGTLPSADQNNFYNIIKNYNIVAIFHGHAHIPELQMTQWQGFDVYNVGTFHTGKFMVVHLRADGLAVAECTGEDSWGVVSLKNFKS